MTTFPPLFKAVILPGRTHLLALLIIPYLVLQKFSHAILISLTSNILNLAAFPPSSGFTQT